MNIHEYQAKRLFNLYGIATPEGQVTSSVGDVEQILQSLGGERWVVKAQVHAGGRGKAGGVEVVANAEQAKSAADRMLGDRLATHQTGPEGLPIESVLIEKTSDIKREFYISLLLDRATEQLIFIASAAGGMDIEKVAEENPELILKTSIKTAGIQSWQCRKLGFALGLQGVQIRELEKFMRAMVQLFIDKDASQVEINPLIETGDGHLMALDAKINFDDNALMLHPDIEELRDSGQEDEKENSAQAIGLNYIALDGTIGCMVNGAGLAMATMDLVKLRGGEPANFLDVGGGATTERVAAAFKLILSDDKVKSVLVNIFGGIVRCDVIAQGILDAVEEVSVNVPIIVRLEGTNAEAGRDLLNNSELAVIAADDLEIAAAKAVELAG